MATAETIKQRHSGYAERLPQWEKIRDTIEGEDKIKEEGKKYLPIPDGQKSNGAAYRAYKERASFYGIADRTISGLLGLIFRIETIFELPSSMEYLRESATPNGLSLNQLVRETMRDTISVGRIGLLADLPETETIRPQPFIAKYKAEDIWNWTPEIVNGSMRVTRVVLRETPDDRSMPTVLRELTLEHGVYAQIVWREKNGSEGKEDFEMVPDESRVPMVAGKTLDYIPFEFVPKISTSKPPLLDLVNVNIAHYRNSADYEQSMFLTAQPTPYFFGVNADDVPSSIGSSAIWTSTRPDAKAGMIEFTGSGIAALRDAMSDKEARMAVLGARIIRDDSERSNVTAETTRLNAKSDTSVLIDATDVVETAVTRVLRGFIAPWLGAEPDGVNVTVNRDHIETRMTPQEILALVQGWQSNAYSFDTLFENLQRGEVIAPDRTLEEERELISQGAPALGLLGTEPEPSAET